MHDKQNTEEENKYFAQHDMHNKFYNRIKNSIHFNK